MFLLRNCAMRNVLYRLCSMLQLMFVFNVPILSTISSLMEFAYWKKDILCIKMELFLFAIILYKIVSVVNQQLYVINAILIIFLQHLHNVDIVLWLLIIVLIVKVMDSVWSVIKIICIFWAKTIIVFSVI